MEQTARFSGYSYPVPRLVLNYPIHLRDEVVKVVKEELSHPIIIHGRSVVIPVDIDLGQNWKMEEE